jgi:hypothetical protein
MQCSDCNSINVYDIYCKKCTKHGCCICEPCVCELLKFEHHEYNDSNKHWKKCETCSHVYNTKYCPCQTCNAEYVEHPNGRHCEFCYPHITIIGIDFCVDLFPLSNFKSSEQNDIYFCQNCHDFVLDVHSGNMYNNKKYHLQKTHSNHTIIKKYHLLCQIARLKFPQLKKVI